MDDTQALAQARTALREWGAAGEAPRLIKNRENAVFEARLPDGRRAALRLHRPGYQSDAAIRSELVWAQGLADAGLDVPRPLRSLSGDVIARPTGCRVASLVSWSAGVPLGEGDTPLPWPAARQMRLYHALGAELARLHTLSDALCLPGSFTRPRLDLEGLLGPAPLWGRFWENTALTAPESELLRQAGQALAGILRAHLAAGGDFGLIHADALRENVLVTDDGVRLIDFDDGAFGFRLYDLGVAMSQNWREDNASALAAALLDGYQSQRPLTATDCALLPAFITLRALASCGWVIGRYAPQAPQTALYARRAVGAARRFLDMGHLY